MFAGAGAAASGFAASGFPNAAASGSAASAVAATGVSALIVELARRHGVCVSVRERFVRWPRVPRPNASRYVLC